MAKKHKCSVCGEVAEWSDSWSWYGSINHMDTCPEDVPRACSEECSVTVQAKIKSGEWALPTLGNSNPGGHNVIIPKRGY